MQAVENIIKTDDLDKVMFYLDYTEQLIEFFKKRDLCCKELLVEQEMLQKRLDELKREKRIKR